VTYGTAEGAYTEDFNESLKLIKEYVKTINGKVTGKTWLTGEDCTLIDLYVAANLASAY
jgi:glutathione S-transferase